MSPSSRRLDQIIARRRFARPKDRARHLQNLGYQIDGITSIFPTTERPYERTPFIYDPYPEINDVPPSPEDDLLFPNRVIKFGTITEYPIDNLAYTHPSRSKFEHLEYTDWQRHAPILLDFFNFVDTTTDDVRKGQIISQYWKGHFRAPPVEARIVEALAERAGQLVLPPGINEDISRVPPNVSLAEEHPSDEENTDSSEDGSDESTRKRQKRFDHYVGPCVSCTLSPHFPGIELNAATFGRTHFTHLDTSGHQFTILPGVDYHFNDVTVSLTENRTGLEILAICPEVVDVTNLPDTTGNSPTTSRKKRKTYTTATARTYNLRPNNRRPTITTTSTDDSSISTSSSESYTSEDTPPPSYYDPTYNPTQYESEEEELVIDTSDSGTSTSDSSSSEDSSEPPAINILRHTYGLRSTNRQWHTAVQEGVRALSLAVPEEIDLTQSDTDSDTSDEAGDIIVRNETI